MIHNPRIYISSPMDKSLDSNQVAIKHAILQILENAGLEPQEFLVSGDPFSMSWGFEAADQVMSRCQGALILAFVRWRLPVSPDEMILVPSEYNHYEGALAISHKVPILVITEEGVTNRGIVWVGGGLPITYIPTGMTPDWLKDQLFQKRFRAWCNEIKSRPRVFLGYCSQARATSDAITLYLERTLNVKVRNYAMDFQAGGTILEEIEKASRDCTCGIFLFTKDDPLAGLDQNHAAPRDNVVFEAGYFMHAKGKERVLVIREERAKMPADLGGNIYIHLKDRNDISTIHTQLQKFLQERL